MVALAWLESVGISYSLLSLLGDRGRGCVGHALAGFVCGHVDGAETEWFDGGESATEFGDIERWREYNKVNLAGSLTAYIPPEPCILPYLTCPQAVLLTT